MASGVAAPRAAYFDTASAYAALFGGPAAYRAPRIRLRPNRPLPPTRPFTPHPTLAEQAFPPTRPIAPRCQGGA
ncbi:hypothetical protein GCM10010449_01070 [Streptomyces rectiviolaceus]|uniref:Uncharacterized protein n=1 Tax=Streptomyces rectiviolaceus TaxID=332591 RepID=A0ABP6M5M6_9ACTN